MGAVLIPYHFSYHDRTTWLQPKRTVCKAPSREAIVIDVQDTRTR